MVVRPNRRSLKSKGSDASVLWEPVGEFEKCKVRGGSLFGNLGKLWRALPNSDIEKAPRATLVSILDFVVRTGPHAMPGGQHQIARDCSCGAEEIVGTDNPYDR